MHFVALWRFRAALRSASKDWPTRLVAVSTSDNHPACFGGGVMHLVRSGDSPLNWTPSEFRVAA